jgi:carbonic anhydrase/acetyltransferase-like protein (isoleucine patch superfamily)
MIMPFQKRYPKIDPSAFVAENALVIGDVDIGPDTSIWFYSVIRGDTDRIRIGSRCNIQDACVIHVGDQQPTIIEDEVSLAHRVVVHGCRLKKRSLIAIGAIVLNGAEVGEESMIGAGSLVGPHSVIPPRTLAMGIPAKPVRTLREEDLYIIHHTIEDYLKLKEMYRSSCQPQSQSFDSPGQMPGLAFDLHSGQGT